VKIVRWDPEARYFEVDLPGEGVILVRTFDYPGWIASIDGSPARIERGALGEITLRVPAGHHQIELRFINTVIRRVGNWLTLLAVCIILVLLWDGFGRREGRGSGRTITTS
jgi:hypothetical protein